VAIQGRGYVVPLIKLVIFTVVTVLATAFLASTLAAFGAGDGHTYKARFSNVAGLLAGDHVRIAGVQVGRVNDIALIDNRFAEVSFVVDDKIKLPKTVEAKIRYRNLSGSVTSRSPRAPASMGGWRRTGPSR
jgi:ABC-type transport system involved in resistance to organic solvents, periplasmic component